jgi:hypothetical protein
LAALALAVTVGLGGCRDDDDDDEPSFRELIVDLEGGDITQSELARRQEVADFLCDLDGRILEAIWADLDAVQLEFQDVVFQSECSERLDEYAAATGRFRVGDTDD